MDFAQGILHKYGWSEGQGLGKQNSGITKPLKANLKFNTTGLGHDGAADFKDNWWEKAYNSAASNLDVRSSEEGGVRMELKDGESVKISTTGFTGREGKSSMYGNFVKSSTLTAEGREKRDEEQESIDGFGDYTPLARPLTDDELFKACGGRTAHKGARHGLTLSGKLSRLAQQDNALLQKISEDRKESEDYNDWQRKISKKKKRRPIAAPTPHGSPEATRDELQDLLYLSEYLESPAARRREGKVDKELSEATSKIDLSSAAMPKQKLLKVSKKSLEICKKHKKDKKKKKHREATTTAISQEGEGMDEILNEFRATLKKRIKKKEERQARKLEKKAKRRHEIDSETSVDFLDSNRESSNSTDYFAGDTRSHKRLRVGAAAEDPLVERGVFETSTGIQVEMDDPAPEKRSYSRSNIRRSLNKSVGKITDRFARSLTTKEPSDDEGIDP